jgi:hypothetical protein
VEELADTIISNLPQERRFGSNSDKGARPWTEKQVAVRKDQAERLTRDVLEDDRADEIADMSV